MLKCKVCGFRLADEAAKTADERYLEPHGTKCVQCGAPLPADAKFCYECGTKQESTCSQCGAQREAAPSATSTANNAAPSAGGIKETPLEMFEYEVRGGKYILTGGKDTSLTDIVVPNAVTEISDGAFAGCSSLTYVTIPNSVIKIGIIAFIHCHSLKKVSIKNPNFKKSDIKRVFGDSPSFTEIKIGDRIVKVSDLD